MNEKVIIILNLKVNNRGIDMNKIVPKINQRKIKK